VREREMHVLLATCTYYSSGDMLHALSAKAVTGVVEISGNL
jgi:hypothetical protein